jgi:OmpA-OmpF porin, OOP family
MLLGGYGLILASTACSADTRNDGFYASLLGGANFLDYARTSVKTPETTVHGHTSFDTGWLAGAAAGHEWPIGIALEEEFTFRTNNLDKISNLSHNLGVISLYGHERSYDIMTNVYYRWHNPTPLTPYIAGGIGEAILQLENARAPGFGPGSFSGVDTEFGYQGIAGISYNVLERLSLAIEYRYFGTLRPGIEDTVTGVGNVRFHGGYHANDGLLRLTYHFK